MMKTYDDLFIRDQLNDTGTIPSPPGSAFLSPDIIVWGSEPLVDPHVYLVENYECTWRNNIVANQFNYIYCRVTNLSTTSSKGRLYLYYAWGGFMVDVQSWSKNRLTTAIPGQDYININTTRAGQKGDISVGDSAFVWSPDKEIADTHNCFVAQICTEEHPNSLPEQFESSEEYANWVINNPAIAWSNYNVVTPTSPHIYIGSYAFENLDPVRAEYLFLARTENLPTGTKVTMVCAADGPFPPIDTTSSITELNTTVSQTSMLPSHFSGYLDVSIDLPEGQQWDPKMVVIFEFYRIVDFDASELMQSLGVPTHLLDSQNTALTNRSDISVRLGSFTVIAHS